MAPERCLDALTLPDQRPHERSGRTVTLAHHQVHDRGSDAAGQPGKGLCDRLRIGLYSWLWAGGQRLPRCGGLGLSYVGFYVARL